MKKLNCLIASSILFSLNANTFDFKNLKKDAKKIGTSIYKNISREEKEIETFKINGEKIHSSQELIDLGKGKVQYSLNKEDKNIYFSIYPKQQNKKNIEYENYFTISENTDLFISFPQDNEISKYSSQGEFVKQKFSGEIKISKKGLLDLEEHPEAEKMIKDAKNALENIVSIFGEKIQKKFERIPNKYDLEYLEEMKEELKVPKNFKFNRIPIGIPDKLIGQKLSGIEYKISFEKNPSNFTIYSVLDLKEHEYKLFKKIEE